MKSVIILFWLVNFVICDFSQLGCFKQSSVQSSLSDDKGEYIWQSTGYCQQQCSGSKYAALISGSTCYCGDVTIDKLDSVSMSNCDTPCQGYNTANCGGDGYFLVFEDSSVVASAGGDDSSSSSSTSSSSSSTSSSSSSTSSSSSSSSTSTEASSSITDTSSSSEITSNSATSDDASTLVSTVTNGGGVTTVTKTTGPTSSASDSNNDNNENNNNNNNDKKEKKSSGLSGGAIAGVVIGSLAGVGLLGLLAFLLFFKRRNNDDDENSEFGDNEKNIDGFALAPPKNYNGNDNITPNPFVTKNSTIKSKHTKNQSFNTNSFNSNNEDFMFENPQNNNEGLPYPTEDYGRRRLSDGSLPDMVTKGSLKVVNN